MILLWLGRLQRSDPSFITRSGLLLMRTNSSDFFLCHVHFSRITSLMLSYDINTEHDGQATMVACKLRLLLCLSLWKFKQLNLTFSRSLDGYCVSEWCSSHSWLKSLVTRNARCATLWVGVWISLFRRILNWLIGLKVYKVYCHRCPTLHSTFKRRAWYVSWFKIYYE
jgi:hypothetical protein